jgi:hypothetical protein
MVSIAAATASRPGQRYAPVLMSGKGHGASAELVRHLKRAPVAGFKQRAITLSRLVVRADGVNYPARRQVSCGRPPGVPGGKPVRKPFDAVLQYCRAARAVDPAFSYGFCASPWTTIELPIGPRELA